MFIRTLIALLIILSSSAAIAEEPVSHEEHILMSHLMSLQAGLAYDEICNKTDPQHRFDFTKPENTNLYATLEMISERLDKVMGVEENEKDADIITNKYVTITADSMKPIRDSLEEFGCDNQNARNAEQSFNYYFNTNPSQIYMAIDEQIKAKIEEQQ